MTFLSIQDALLVVFKHFGLQILEQPDSLRSALLDLCDKNSPAIDALLKHCSIELTMPLIDAAEIGTTNACLEAGKEIQYYLHYTLEVSAEISESIGSQMSLALDEMLDNHNADVEDDRFLPNQLSDSENVNDCLEWPLIAPYTIESLDDKHARTIPLWASSLIAVSAVFIAIATVSILISVFRDLTKPTISFNGGGASGKMEPTHVDAGTAYTLPACTYKRPGFEFDGWQILSSGKLLDAGEEFEVYSDETLIAQWDIIDYTDLLGVKCFNSYVDTTGSAAFIVLQNKSVETLDVTARFKFTDTDGTELDSSSDDCASVPPNQVIILGTIEQDSILSISKESFYSLEAGIAKRNNRHYLPIEELSVSKRELSVRIKNNTNSSLRVEATALGLSSEGYSFCSEWLQDDSGDTAWLEPGKSWDCTFRLENKQKEGAVSNLPWSKLDRYVFAYGER